MGYKILHFADLHLDTDFSNDGMPLGYGQERRLVLRATLTHILALAREHRVDAVTIAGDLYDQEYATPETAEFLTQQFERLSPIQVVIAPGESDPYTNESLYTRVVWPKNVHIFSQGQLHAFDLTPKIKIWGLAYPPARKTKLLDGFKPQQDQTNILLLHATFTYGTNESIHNLIRLEDEMLRDIGLACALLGHEHMGKLLAQDPPLCAYPGSPEPLTWDESLGDHQVFLVDIQDGQCKLETIPITGWRYESHEIDLTEIDSIEEAAQKIDQVFASETESEIRQTSYQLLLRGMPEFALNLQSLRELVGIKANFRIWAQVEMPYDREQIASEQTTRGFLVSRFLEKLSSTQDQNEKRLIMTALNFALLALDGKQVSLNEITPN